MEFFLARQTMDPIGLVFSPSSSTCSWCGLSLHKGGDVDHSLESTTFFIDIKHRQEEKNLFYTRKETKRGDTLVGDEQVVARRITMKNHSALLLLLIFDEAPSTTSFTVRTMGEGTSKGNGIGCVCVCV